MYYLQGYRLELIWLRSTLPVQTLATRRQKVAHRCFSELEAEGKAALSKKECETISVVDLTTFSIISSLSNGMDHILLGNSNPYILLWHLLNLGVCIQILCLSYLHIY